MTTSAQQLFLCDEIEQEFVRVYESPVYEFQARLLKALQKAGNPTDAEVVRATGINFSTWLKWTKGEVENPVAGSDFKAVCLFLGVSADFLLGLKDEF